MEIKDLSHNLQYQEQSFLRTIPTTIQTIDSAESFRTDSLHP